MMVVSPFDLYRVAATLVGIAITALGVIGMAGSMRHPFVWRRMLYLMGHGRQFTVEPPLPEILHMGPPARLFLMVGTGVIGGGVLGGMIPTVVPWLTVEPWRIPIGTHIIGVVATTGIGGLCGMAGVIWWYRFTTQRAIERHLPTAVSLLAASLHNGHVFAVALDHACQHLPPSAVRDEWLWMRQKIGVVLPSGVAALPGEVVAAASVQSPSPLSRYVLSVFATALGWPNRMYHTDQAVTTAVVKGVLDWLRRGNSRRAVVVEIMGHIRGTAVIISLLIVALDIVFMVMAGSYAWRAYTRPMIGPIMALANLVSIVFPPLVATIITRDDDATLL